MWLAHLHIGLNANIPSKLLLFSTNRATPVILPHNTFSLPISLLPLRITYSNTLSTFVLMFCICSKITNSLLYLIKYWFPFVFTLLPTSVVLYLIIPHLSNFIVYIKNVINLGTCWKHWHQKSSLEIWRFCSEYTTIDSCQSGSNSSNLF